MTFIWYAITFLIYFDTSFDFEMKRKKKKKLYYFKKKKKKFDLCPQGIQIHPSLDAHKHSTPPYAQFFK